MHINRHHVSLCVCVCLCTLPDDDNKPVNPKTRVNAKTTNDNSEKLQNCSMEGPNFGLCDFLPLCIQRDRTQDGLEMSPAA